LFAFALEVVRILGLPFKAGKSFLKKVQSSQSLGEIGGGLPMRQQE